ncbi:usg protein [Siccirubricoccus deserti]|uniref:Usg protein n=1 Tax=Siccirubricoccus deserti TaxID=2013562 RepID=A0A9X0UGY2_9PROT|nr:usg protein [Siccirubricoccus deserti]
MAEFVRIRGGTRRTTASQSGSGKGILRVLNSLERFVRSPELRFPDWRLTTAEILYHMPDTPAVLQTFVWQKLDLAPEFPELSRFLDFWKREIEGPLHSVRVASAALTRPAELRYANGQFLLH